MSIHPVKKAILLALSLCLFACMPAFAQGDHGAVNGRVTDPLGAQVPNAKVVIVEESTRVTLTTQTNATGEYSFPTLVPGKYTITVSMAGFKNYKEEHVQVDLGPTTQVDLPLQVGGSDTTVTVNGQGQLLNYDSADLGLVVEEKSMTDLPLIYGNAFSLENLTPGLVLSGVNPNVHVYDSGTSNVSINGSLTNSIDYKLDGAADNRIRTTAFTPNTESISQYRLATSTYDTSQGHASGGFTNVQAKSGTDRIRGSIYGYYQNPNINANSWTLAGTRDQIKPRFLREGFSFGGPVFKRKLFYFAGFEHSSQTNPVNSIANVPTQAQIAGDFSALYALDTTATGKNVCGTTPAPLASPNAYQIFDPRSSVGPSNQRLCIPGNNVAKYLSGVDPVAAAALKIYPAANGGTAAIGTYTYGIPNADNYTGAIVRFDYSINPQQQMYMHLVRSSRLSQPGLAFPPISTAYLSYDNYGLAIGHSVALSPTLVLSSVASYTRFVDYNINPAEGQVTPTTIGMPAYLTNGLPHSAKVFPRFDLTQYTSTNTSSDFQNEDDIWLGSVSLSKQLSTHFLRTGVEYRRYNTAGQGGGTENGDYASNGNFATTANGTNASALAGAGAGLSVAEFEMGILSSGSQVQNADYLTRSTYLAFFAQDDWRATRRLTVNVGLRWEHENPLKELNGKAIAAFNFDAVNATTGPAASAYIASGASSASTLLPAAINPTGGAIFENTNGYGLEGYQAPTFDFSPRIGFAFAVAQKTVLRGGFGLFFDSLQTYYLSSTNSGSTTTITLPQQGYSQTSTVVAPSYSSTGVTITSTLDNPFPNGLTPITGNRAGVNTAIGQDIQFYQPHPHTPYNERWNLGFQQQVGSFVININYVGNHGVHTPTLQSSQGTNYGGRDYNAVPSKYLSTYQGGYDQNENAILGTATIANPFTGLFSGTSSYIGSGTVSVGQMLRPRPEFGRINAYTFDGQSIYHSAQIQVQRRFTNGFSTTQAFTWSKAMDATNFLNPSDSKPWYGVSTVDRPLRYSTSFIYQLPWGHNRHWLSHTHGVVAQVVGGWQVQGVYQIQSGQPLNMGNDIYYGRNQGDSHWSKAQYKATQILANGTQSAVGGFWFNPANFLVSSTVVQLHPGANLPNVISTCPKYLATDSTTWYCTTAEPGANQVRIAPLRYGTLRADHLNQTDFGIQRQFQIREYGTLQFRAEAVNLFNHPVYSAPNTDPTNSLFGEITGQANQSRVYQFAGFFRF